MIIFLIKRFSILLVGVSSLLGVYQCMLVLSTHLLCLQQYNAHCMHKTAHKTEASYIYMGAAYIQGCMGKVSRGNNKSSYHLQVSEQLGFSYDSDPMAAASQ